MQRYKIYINESPLILMHSSDLEAETAFERSLIHAKYAGKPKLLLNYIELLEKNKHHEGIIWSNSGTISNRFIIISRPQEVL
jgi:hypothetical protein